MGRYYWGDIDGKFGFAVQTSNDADFFGVTGYQPSNLIVNHLDKYNKITKDKTHIDVGSVSSQLGINENTFNNFLKVNARLHLGLQIKESIEKNGQCHFKAEL